MAQTQDHTGRAWPSVKAMCDAFNIPMTTFNNRLKRGWTLEQALTTPRDTTRPKHKFVKPVKDFKGVEYPTVGAMCAVYGISEKVYWSRKRILKWDLEKILTTPLQTIAKNAKQVTDHNGKVFNSISELCRYHKIGLSTFRERIKRGWTIEEALTGHVERKKIESRPVPGPDGKNYPSVNAMCRANHISRTMYLSRIRAGWDEHDAATQPFVINAKPCTDMFGKSFPATFLMAEYHRLPKYAVQGKDLSRSHLIRLIRQTWSGTSCGKYRNLRPLTWPWFLASIKNNDVIVPYQMLLKIYHDSQDFIPVRETGAKNQKVKILKNLGFPWFLCEMDSTQYVLDYDTIIRIHVDSNFGLTRK